MPRRRREIRDGQAFCRYHQQWQPIEDFDWHAYRTADGSVGRLPKSNCRLAEQTQRDADKELDPARTAIEGRSKSFAANVSKSFKDASISYKWVPLELNWRALIPVMRALLGPDGRCLNCGEHQGDVRNYHIEHRLPPLNILDWPAQHARNLWIACGGCNMEKGRHDADRDWLEQEQRKWMIVREWSRHAAEKDWGGPPPEPSWPKADYPRASLLGQMPFLFDYDRM